MGIASREVFEGCLTDGTVSPDTIVALVRTRTPEDLYLDYKGGRLFANGNAGKLRSAVAGFANGEGGLLLVGVNGGDVNPIDECWRVDGCPETVGKQPLLDWIASSLRELSPYLHPYPKIGTVTVGQDVVAFVATARSSVLVPCLEGSRGVVHYLRFHGQTYPAPPYLLADLLLGRRQRPTFVAGPEFDPSISDKAVQAAGRGRAQATLDMSVPVRNSSALWATDPMAGLIGPSLLKQQSIPPELMACVNAHRGGVSQVVASLSDAKLLRPFQSAASVEATITLPDMSAFCEAYKAAERAFYETRGRPVGPKLRLRWHGALYVFCREAPPDWFQVEVVHDVVGDTPPIKTERNGRAFRPSGLPTAGFSIHGRHMAHGAWVTLDITSPQMTAALVTK